MSGLETEDGDGDGVNWHLCVLCQEKKNEKLIKPYCMNKNDGYQLLAKNLLEFHELQDMPIPLRPYLIDNIQELKTIFYKNKASWHRSCYLKCNNNNLERTRKRAKKTLSTNEQTSDSPPKTRGSSSTQYDKETCIFCQQPASRSMPLSTVMQKSCNDNIIQFAKELNDYELLAKVSERCDLIALEAKYHLKCITMYKNRVRASEISSEYNIKKQVESIAFAGLVNYIKESKESIDNPIFSVSDLAKIQAEIMDSLGTPTSYIHTSRLRQKLLEECPFLTSCDKPGLSSLIVFKENAEQILRTLATRDYQAEGDALCEVASQIRKDIFNETIANTNKSAFPTSLLALIKMILYGTTLNSETCDDRLCTNIAEVILYNTLRCKKRGTTRRHEKGYETTVPVYLATKIYTKTRNHNLVDSLHQLGLAISYKRLQSIISEKASEICTIYKKENVVCPPSLKKNLFTTAAVDNIDHNPPSPTADTAFHGTAISLMQHQLPGEEGLPRNTTVTAPQNEELDRFTCHSLPNDYTVVSPCFADLKKSTCPISQITQVEPDEISSTIVEKRWLDDTMGDDVNSWEAYNSANDRDTDKRHKTTVALLPLFLDQAHSAAMMLHTMGIVSKATHFLNPGQIPVLVADQPLYALLKELQYAFPEKFGEEEMFVMMGGLHIEMAALKAIGQWLSGSGWVDVLVRSDIVTPGRAESMIQASQVVRTRYGHQVTAAALHSLQQQAYLEYVESINDEPQSFQAWRQEKLSQIPQFKYWDTVLEFELIILQLVRSIRTGDFNDYTNSLRKLIPWFFCLDRINYARWVSVHLRDLANLKNTHPSLLKAFENGLFVARKSNRQFSGMALDQAHEQVNSHLKGDGGIIGLTESPDTLQKWLIAGPELADMVDDFETKQFKSKSAEKSDNRHHSDKVANKKKFIANLQSLKTVLEECGNPFLEKSLELYNVETKRVYSDDVVKTVMNIEKNGERLYQSFCEERLKNGKNIHDPIPLNKYKIFSHIDKKTVTKTKTQISQLKSNSSLFSKLYISTCEHRKGDLDTFFAHENQTTPPSLASMGEMRLGNKAELIKCLSSETEMAERQNAPDVSVKVLDGSAIVHMLNPRNCSTFGDYADTVFIPFLHKELSDVSRLDVVWDSYDLGSKSLKRATRLKRGTGQRLKLTSKTKVPKGWANFLRDDSNKKELFELLGSHCFTASLSNSKEIIMTKGTSVLSNSTRTSEILQPCDHEEADTRMMVHVADAVNQGFTKIMLRTVDTDVVVLAVSCVPKLPQLEELWVHIGTGNNHKYLACHAIAASLGPDKSQVLPIFHAFTGCDTVSSFNGRGKKRAYEAWKSFPTVTAAFKSLLENTDIEEVMPVIQQFVVAMYDKSCPYQTVNDCRKYLFTKRDRQIENIPPTEGALIQHLRRAVFQGIHVWGRALKTDQCLPSPSEWGWVQEEESWVPIWTTLPMVAQACLETVRCRCKKCSNRCSCFKKNIKCTDLCMCEGHCI